MTGLPTRSPGAGLTQPDAVEAHTPPGRDTMLRVLACLRASLTCWRCADNHAELAPSGEVNGPHGTLPLHLCPTCLAHPDDPTACWRCTTPHPTLTTHGATTTQHTTTPLRLCPTCLAHLTHTYATSTPSPSGPAR